MNKAICILSGGLDSATTLGIAMSENDEVIALHFDYNQRTMDKEKECFLKLCKHYDIKGEIIDANFIAQIGANSLTDTSMQIKKSDTFIKSDEVPNTYVPFRNGVFLSIAGALAEKEKANAIYIGVVWEDSSGYPDCKIEFINAANEFIKQGSSYLNELKIKAPLINLKKDEIIQKAISLKVPLEHTWSCYESNDKACGKCESCLLRLRGFEKLGIKDKINYKE